MMINTHFYTTFADAYDAIYSYIPYARQTEFFLSIIQRFGRREGCRLLDLCCGTGTHADLLQKSGCEVTAFDLSPHMIEIASRKNEKVHWAVDDMRSFTSSKRFDVALCFFNSILYHETSDSLAASFRKWREILAPGALLIFDAFDKDAVILNSPNVQQISISHNGKQLTYTARWRMDEASERIELCIDFEEDGKKISDIHRMGAFHLDEIRARCEAAGFIVTLYERDFSALKELQPGASEAIFVAKPIA